MNCWIEMPGEPTCRLADSVMTLDAEADVRGAYGTRRGILAEPMG